MPDMLHQIQIACAAQALRDALTSEAGLRAWWTGDSVARPEVGSVAEFGFGGRATVMRMRIDESGPLRLVWSCLGDPDEWRGTQLVWTWQLAEAGGCVLNFRHNGWASDQGWFAHCNTTWGELLHRLKDHLEGRSRGPLFSGAA